MAEPVQPKVAALLAAAPRVVNIGLSGFAEELREAGVKVVELDWSPSRATARARALLSRLL